MAPAASSAQDDPVLGVDRHWSLDVPVRRAAAPASWSAADDPVRGLPSLWLCFALSPLRCCSSASSGPPTLCFSAGSRGFMGGLGAFWWALPAWLGVAWHRLLCRGRVVVARAVPVCGTRQPLLLGTCSCAVVVASGVLLLRALLPRVLRRTSSGLVALGALVGFPDAVVPFPSPRALAPGFTGRSRRARGGQPRTGLILPASGPCQGRGAGLAPRRPWWVPPALVLGCLRCGVGRVWTQSLTRRASRTVRCSTRDSAGAPGLFRVDADTSPCGSGDATPGSRVCVRVLVLPGRDGQAGLTGAFWCPSPFLWPYRPPALLGALRALVAPSCWCNRLLSVFFSPQWFFSSAGFPTLVSWDLALFVSPPPFLLFDLAFLLWLVLVSCRPPSPLPAPPSLFFPAPCLTRCLFPLALLFILLAPFPCLLFFLPPPPLPFFSLLFLALPALVGVRFLRPPLPFFCVLVLISPRCPFPLPRPPHLLFCFPLPPPPPSLFFSFWCFLLWLVFVFCRLPAPPPSPRAFVCFFVFCPPLP